MIKTYKTTSMLSFRILLISLLSLTSCEDFVKIDPPRTELVKASMFSSDVTAEAAILDIYYQLRVGGFASGHTFSITYLNSLTSDELDNYYASSPQVTEEIKHFNDNSLLPNNQFVYELWTQLYGCIYKTNSVIEGLASNSLVSESLKTQLEGEAKFIRAFCFFYLVNLFGDVPLTTTTDYRINSALGRTSTSKIYQQIISDLNEAQNLLSDDYSISNNERVRPNKATVTALLARVYLYTNDWLNAETQASTLISNNNYGLVDNLNEVTTKNNIEAIWQLWSDSYPLELFTFYIFTATPRVGALRDEFVNSFESSDQRRSLWIGTMGTYYFARKYSSFTLTEYSTVLRLAEQYLIRAEARAQQNDIAGAQADVNVIRHRAGLGDTPANDKESLLTAIEQERKHELFNEWGHRWLDLKRTGRADAVLSAIKPQWKPTAVLFPIPESEIINNPALKQNPGY